MRTVAALLERAHEPVDVVDLDIEPPRAGEVMVEIAATGVCHSDLSVADGSLDNPMPVVLGHEGAGTIIDLGAGVTDLAVGDHVVLAWLAQCGECFYCVHGQAELCERAGLSFARSNLPDGTTRRMLKLDELVTERFSLADTAEAIEYCRQGHGVRGVVVMK
ncbi:MAG: alcohol dehydrogenase catalytic domain-containing protein [Streptosporangiaceae bacterium]